MRALESLADKFHLPVHMPMDEHTLCVAVCLRAQEVKVTTLPGFVSAIADWTRTTWPGSELPRGHLFNTVMASLRKLHGDEATGTPKVALTMDDLLGIHRHLDTRHFEHARDWCACLIAFFGMLRIGEYMDARLRHGHVRAAADGLTVTVLYSKTSLAPRYIALAARSDALCPVQAFLHYRAFLARLAIAAGPDDAVFIYRFDDGRRSPMTKQQFTLLVRAHMATAFPHRDMSGYAGHSFRRGGASALILAGVPASVVQAHGRWTTDTYRRYLDTTHSQAVRLAATQALPGARR